MTDETAHIATTAAALDDPYAAPQPSPDREALVGVILGAMLGRYPGREMARAVADALLASGLRLPALADLDLSPEAVERLTKMAETLESSAVNAERMCELLQPEFDAFEARTGHNRYVVRDYVDHMSAAKRQRLEASAIRALLAERDAAWKAGAEAMREAAANVASNACLVPPDGGNPTEEERLVCEEAWRRIRALPLPNQASIGVSK